MLNNCQPSVSEKANNLSDLKNPIKYTFTDQALSGEVPTI